MNRLRALREDADLRQIDVAMATGIDQKTLSNYETGKTSPDSEAIIRLAEFFHVTTDYLLGVHDLNLKNTKAVISELGEIQKRLSEISRRLNK